MRNKDIALLTLTITIVAFAVVLQFMTQTAQESLEAIQSSLEVPEPVRHFVALVSGEAGTSGKFDSTTVPAAVNPDALCGPPLSTMQQWVTLFEEAGLWTNADDISLDGWSGQAAPDGGSILHSLTQDESRNLETFLERVRALAPCGGPLYPIALTAECLEQQPHWNSLTDVASLLFYDARHAKEQEDTARAVANLIAAMQVADALALEPLFDAQTVRFTVYRLALHCYMELLGDTVLPHELSAPLSAHLAQAHHAEGLHTGISGELIMTGHYFASFRVEGYRDSINKFGILVATNRQLWRSPFFRPYFLEDERSALEFLQRIAAIPISPYYKIKPDLKQILKDVDALPITRDHIKHIVPSIARSGFLGQACHEIAVDLWRLRLLVQRFESETGALPRNLEEAASRFGEGLPIDPSIGKPYGYQSDGDCYRLRSGLPALIIQSGQLRASADDLESMSQICPR
ncbi:MAG: hypothetical protein HYV27_12395 [Candidatus Hydrogenedentes bacterium]|nr:hypothetical protein [Candidatus Hydrogenedentota bacterium]